MQADAGSTGRGGVALAIDELDLGALGRALWRRKVLILGATLLAAAAAFAAVNMVTPRYKSEARVLIETRDNIFLRPEAERATERATTVDQEAVTSQVQLILSRGLALDVIRRLRLGEKPEFDPVLRGPSLPTTVLGLIGLIKDPMSQTPEERVLKSYMDRLAAFQVDKSRVIAIEFESQDPELAAAVVNAIAEGFLVLQQAARQEQTRAAGQWLSGEIETLRRSLAEAESKVEQYRANTNLLIGTNGTTLSTQQLGDFNAQLASARAQKAEAESKARIIRDALHRGAPADFSDFINSELLRRLSEQHVTLRAQLAEQSSTLLGQHPRIKELRAQIADLERQMRLEADRLARSFENDAKIANGRVEALTSSLDQLKKQAASSNAQDVQLRALEREAKSQRDLLESYLAKFREASARDSISASSPEARIISRGIVSSTPSWPKKLPTVLIAAFGTFTLFAGFIVTGQLMSAPLPGVPSVVPEALEPRSPLPPIVRDRSGLAGSGFAGSGFVDPSLAGDVPAVAPPVALAESKASAAVVPTAAAGEPNIGAPVVVAAAAATVASPSGAPTSGQSLVAKLRARLRAGSKSATAPPTPAREPGAAVAPSAAAVMTSGEVPQSPAPLAGDGAASDGVEGLAAALRNAGDSGRRIAVVGARRNMGTTLAAISLARALARQGRTILVDLALASPNLSVIATDVAAPGLMELVSGAASFGQIITRDRYSRVHVITVGKGDAAAAAILGSQRLAITLEALARSYDFVVLDAGALPVISPEAFARLAPRAVLVADAIDGPATEAARGRLFAAGFPNVSVLANAPDGPESDAGGDRAAA